MAETRPSPYIWVTWLASIMGGADICHWQAWFQTHNKLTQKQPSDFNLAGWTVDHTRMLTELSEKLDEIDGAIYRKEYELRCKFPQYSSVLAGKADCVLWEASKITIFECKTGKERITDQIQVMIYMWMLERTHNIGDKSLAGEVIYSNQRVSIGDLKDDFAENIVYFVKLLSSDNEVKKAPGDGCRFCPITKTDCPERIDSLAEDNCIDKGSA